MAKTASASPWSRLIELAILFSFAALLFTLYSLNYLDRIIGNDLSRWFFALIVTVVVLVEAVSFAGIKTDVHFWSWFTTGLGMLGTVLGFSMALAGIDASALQDPSSLSMEIGQFLKTVAFAIDTTLIGLSAAMIMEGMNKIRETLYQRAKEPESTLEID